ncbi:hypothetical transmembrane protein [Neisseria lactamica 020-06]|nr:hypothetical transmembrane protein [Neisseria lactamica 020-06]
MFQTASAEKHRKCRLKPLSYMAYTSTIGKNMDEAVFADWALKICLTGLIIFLGFIVWNLGKESKAGKFGIAILFLVLGLGVFGFVFKELLIKFLVLPK